MVIDASSLHYCTDSQQGSQTISPGIKKYSESESKSESETTDCNLSRTTGFF